MTTNPYESPGEANNATGGAAGWGSFLFKVFLGVGLLGLLIALLLPMRRTAPEAGRRATCVNNLKNITLALQNYEASYHSFPPAYTVDASGNRLHSWRTLILPQLDRNDLYKKVDFTKPWNDPANREVYESEMGIYRCPSAAGIPIDHTTYAAVVAPDGIFSGSAGRAKEEIADGASNTILVLETEPARSVHWMSPEDVDEKWLLGLANVEELSHRGGVNIAFADGRVQLLRQDHEAKTFRALISIAGGDNENVPALE